MPWVKIDDKFSEHPKWGNADPFEITWFVFALCYCNRNLTDGFIPLGIARKLTSPYGYRQESDPYQIIERLVRRGILHEAEQDGQPGVRLHDFLDFQPSKNEIIKGREQTKIRVQNLRKRNAKRNGVTGALVTLPPDPDPVSLYKEHKEIKDHVRKVRANGQTPTSAMPVYLTDAEPTKTEIDLARKHRQKVAGRCYHEPPHEHGQNAECLRVIALGMRRN